MNDAEVFGMYMAGLRELDYNMCMKAIGILYSQNNEKAEFRDIEINFIQGNYEYVTYLAESVRERGKSSRAIDEFYYASLALCNRFPTLRRELRKTKKTPISAYCGDYIQSILLKKNESLNDKFNTIWWEDTAFRRINLDRTITELIDIYEMQKALYEAYQGDKEEIEGRYELIDEKIKLVSIFSDYVTEIKRSVENRTIIAPKNIYLLFLQCYRSEGTNHKGEKLTISELRDVLRLFDLLRRLKLFNELLDEIDLAEDIVFDAVRRQNKTAANYLKEIYYELLHYELFYDDVVDLEKKDLICKKCGSILNQYFPELLIDINEAKNSSSVYSVLSDVARPMFRAAEWQYKAVLEDANYGFRDAGMLCLAYIRLLELEMNTRTLPIIWNDYAIVENEYLRIKPPDTASKTKKKKFSYRWGAVESLKPNSKGLTAGEWGQLLKTLSSQNKNADEETLYTKITDIFEKNIFNQNGSNALKNGSLAKVFDQSTIVDKYRNPPAHTRYVTLDVALECKQYVEKELVFLEGLFKNSNSVE